MKACKIEFFWIAVIFAVSMLGCRDEKDGRNGTLDVGPTGRVQLPLTATGASGALYRLRDGIFDIYGTTTDVSVTVSTEDDPNAETIELSLKPDLYRVYLRDGYRLERVDTPSGDTDSDTFDFSEKRQIADILEWKASHPGKKLSIDRGRSKEEKLVEAIAAVTRNQANTNSDVSNVELISENPVFIEVGSDTTSTVYFAFRVNGDIVNPGTLTIGITVEEADASDCTDLYEPNDDYESPASVAFEPPIQAVACPNDDDFYVFSPPVEVGEIFAVTVTFSHAISDIDVILIDSEGMVVDWGESTTDDEIVSGQADGEEFILLVYPYDEDATENPYTVSCEDIPPSNCCEESIAPGCSDDEIEACVCEYDDWCCEMDFDEYCVGIAIIECDAQCDIGGGDCCEASEERGCDDMAVQSCICQIDLDCCLNVYDEWCVLEAMSECDLDCHISDPDSDCCTVGNNPGCTDEDVESCVCDIDPYCCVAPFDSNCVGLAVDICGAEC